MKTPETQAPSGNQPAAQPTGLEETWHAGDRKTVLRFHPALTCELDDQVQPLLDLSRQALAYVRGLGLTPVAQPHMTGTDLRYVAGPLIVFASTWGADVPGWLRAAIRPARLGLVMAGEKNLAAEEEAVAYLLTACLARPLDHDWTGIYLWLGNQVLTRWGRPTPERDLVGVRHEDTPVRDLSGGQADELTRLRLWIRRHVAAAAAHRQPHLAARTS